MMSDGEVPALPALRPTWNLIQHIGVTPPRWRHARQASSPQIASLGGRTAGPAITVMEATPEMHANRLSVTTWGRIVCRAPASSQFMFCVLRILGRPRRPVQSRLDPEDLREVIGALPEVRCGGRFGHPHGPFWSPSTMANGVLWAYFRVIPRRRKYAR